MSTNSTPLRATSTAPTTYSPAMAQSSSKKRKAETSERISEDDPKTAQRSKLPSDPPTGSRAALADQTNTQKKPAKRQKTAHAKSNVALGPDPNASSGTNSPADTPALGEVDLAMEDAPTQDPMVSPKKPRTRKVKAKKSTVQEPEEDDGADAGERRLRAKVTVFNPAPRPAYALWHHDFAAPTPPYDNQEACPINWSKVTIEHDDPSKCQQAYELRRPWDKQPVSWHNIVKEMNIKSAEGGRKCFKAANKAIFKLTGVYFAESPIGLDEDDILLYKELKPLLKGLGEAPATKKKVVAANPLEYGGEAVQLLVFPPGHNGGVGRFVTKEVMDRLPVHELHFFPYSLDNFDRWYTSVFQRHRHTFPRRLYRLEPWTGNSYIHCDNGTPSIAMSDLFETYQLSQEMGTTEVSDMILDEIVQSLQRENDFVNKHEEKQATMQDCDAAVRPMSFDVDDIGLLWEHTESDDPVRRLVLEILYHWILVVEDDIEEHESKLDAGFVQDWKAYINRPDLEQCKAVQGSIHEGKKYRPSDPKKSVAPGKARDENFGQEQGSLQEFCAKYHNHVGYGFECFRSKPESPKLFPEKLDDPKIVKVLFNSVEYRVEDRASHEAVTFDFERMVDEKPDWEWPRIRSIAAYVEGPLGPEDERPCYLEPTYYELDTVDANGRYKFHPGYDLEDWTQPDLEFEESDVYEEPWRKVIKRDVPMSATNYRENKIPIGEDEEGKPIYQSTAIFFETEDPNWYPPDDWKPDMDPRDLWPQELRDCRRWLWVEEGGEIPRIEVERFRPFEVDAPGWKDPFVDRKSKVSVLDILR